MVWDGKGEYLHDGYYFYRLVRFLCGAVMCVCCFVQ